MSDTQLDFLSQSAGIVGALLMLGIPFALWRLALRPWKPKSRIQYALRAAAWPPVILSSALGRPITFALFGIGGIEGFTEALLGIFGGSIVLSPIGFLIGIAVHASRTQKGDA